LGLLDREVCLFGDLFFGMAPSLHAFYVVEQIDRPMLSTSDVLDQAHHEALFVRRLHNESLDAGKRRPVGAESANAVGKDHHARLDDGAALEG
jgi:hypothetical protein